MLIGWHLIPFFLLLKHEVLNQSNDVIFTNYSYSNNIENVKLKLPLITTVL